MEKMPTEGPVGGAPGPLQLKAALANVPDEVLMMIAMFVKERDPSDKEGVLALTKLIPLSATSRKMRGAASDAVRQMIAEPIAVRHLIADALCVSLPHTVSTSLLVRWMQVDSVVKDCVVKEGVMALPMQHEESVAILSRLVDLSKLARSKRVGEKVGEIVEKLIDKAHPALLASLRNATVWTMGQNILMYPDPDALAVEVIERLKGRKNKEVSAVEADEADEAGRRSQGAYEPIASSSGELRKAVSEFIRNESEQRGELIKKHGPLCLWDVSAVEDFGSACCANFSSDLFWDTRSATSMSNMFLGNSSFKGYIGTWDVSKVKTVVGMFTLAGIEDSGVGCWDTTSVSDARWMFRGALNLSADGPDLSRWTFGAGPNMTGMFRESGIVDCGIGNWDVSGAETKDMLKDASKFTGFRSLKPPKWPAGKVTHARVPKQQQMSFGSVAFGVPNAQMAQKVRIARIWEKLARERGRSGSNGGAEPACVIL